MRQTTARLVPLAAIALTWGVAFGGTPLPDPPFSSGGFVAPDSTIAKAEIGVGKILGKYASTLGKCDGAAVNGLQLAYEPNNPTKIMELQDKWTACRQKAVDRYTIGRDKLVLSGAPPCLNAAGIDAIKAQIDAQFPLLGPLVDRDDDAASPDPVTGLNIPDFKIEANGEVAAAKVVTKAGTKAGNCYTKAFKYALKFGGTIPGDILTKIQACFDKVESGALAAMDKLDQTQKLPACLSLATAQFLVTTTVDLAGQFTDDTYCASPSGAFLD